MTILIFIAILLVLIIGHEFGHFVVAKLSKMRVDEFGVGFPPKIIGKKIGETEYTINWLPFGGFVKIFGEDETSASDPRAFARRPKILQASTLIAGPLANIVLAFVLSTFAFIVGTPVVLDSLAEARGVKDTRVMVGFVLPESPAKESGVQQGDRILSLATNKGEFFIDSPETLTELINDSEGVVVLSIKRGNEEISLPIPTEVGLIEEDPERKAIGVATALVGTVSYAPHVAVGKGLVDTARDFIVIFTALISLLASAVTFSADVSNLAGPVGIASLTGEAASFGLGALLSFSALLSINLAIINILPFPALDGGRLLFLGIEVVSRRKIPSSVAQAVNAGGFLILILLMVAVTVGDIFRLAG